MTNLELSPQQVLARYLQRVDVERVFRYLQTPLVIRPVYPSTKQAIQTHIFIALMGYLQLTLLRYYLETQYQECVSLEFLLEELSCLTATVLAPRPTIRLTYAGTRPSWISPLLADLDLLLRYSKVLSDLPRSDA